ncbi:MAG: glycosyltransferase family 4 protein [Candidatus Hodarchaeales archaeon]
MKILHVYDLGPFARGTIVGGIEKHIFSLLSFLAKKGHDCFLLTGSIPGEPPLESIKGVTIIRTDIFGFTERFWNPYNLNFARQFTFLLSGLKRQSEKIAQVDVVNGHIYSAGIIAAIIAKKQKIPCVNTIHGSYYGHWREIAAGRIKPFIFSSLERFLLPLIGNLADLQIHTDFFFARKAIEWGVSKEKVRTILNSVDAAFFQPKAPPQELRLPHPRIIAIRRLVPKNGLHLLIRAFAFVKRQVPTAQLLLIGDGPQKAQLIHLTSQFGVSRSVHFVGTVTNAKVPRYLAAADVVVIPSLIEASSISLLEAMSSGKPCVVTRIPGIQSISDSSSVEYCEPNDPKGLHLAIIKAQELSKNARRRVLQNNTLEKMGQAYEAFYESLL